MAKLLAVGVKNLRSLRDTGLIELKPITVLVGKNSAGKSTVARLLPLLRQTAEVRKREPILWHGRFVDFGSYVDSVSKHSDDKTISFLFKLSIEAETERVRSGTSIPARRRFFDQVGPGIVHATLIVKEGPSRSTQVEAVHIDVGTDRFRISFEPDGSVESIQVNSYRFVPPASPGYSQRVQFNSIFPSIEFLHEVTSRFSSGEEIKSLRLFDPIHAALTQTFFSYALVHGNTAIESVLDIARYLEPWDAPRLLELAKAVPNAPPSWYATAASFSVDDFRFQVLRDMLLAARLDSLLKKIDEVISETTSGCSYIEPLRASAERYYRKQGLAVEEVDSKGSNVPFFLDSLSRSERESFDDWMLTHLQSTAYTSTDGGHLSIRLRDKSGIDANLADVGFGFSQILPVALQLWVSTRPQNKRSLTRRGSVSVLVIEQPELHLHPEYQARIADLCAAVTTRGTASLIVETHSPAFVNRLGILVAEGVIKPEALQVLRFEKGDSDSHTSISPSFFDEKGRLLNWPYGFFDAS